MHLHKIWMIGICADVIITIGFALFAWCLRKGVGIVVEEKSCFKQPQITPVDVEKVVKKALGYWLEIKVSLICAAV